MAFSPSSQHLCFFLENSSQPHSTSSAVKFQRIELELEESIWAHYDVGLRRISASDASFCWRLLFFGQQRHQQSEKQTKQRDLCGTENWWKEALTCSCSACGGRGRLAVFYSPFSACQLSGNLRGPSHRGLFMKRTLEQQTRFDLVELAALLCAYF